MDPLDKLDVLVDENKILTDVNIAAPVKLLWTRLRDKESYLIQQKKLNTIFISDYLTNDVKADTVNYINFTWGELRKYNLPMEVVEIFKNRLTKIQLLLQ
jgi:hypothetical protein